MASVTLVKNQRSRVPVGCVPKGDERADATALITLHCTASHCTDHIALHCIVLYCIALHCIILHCIILQYDALHSTVLCTEQNALHCIAPHCTTLSSVLLLSPLSAE